MTDDTLTGPPGPRATHALLEVLGVLRDVAESHQMQSRRMDAAEALRLTESAILDVASLHEYVEVQEGNLHLMCQDLNEAHREINRLRALIPAAMRDAEVEQALAASHVQDACAHFNETRVRTDALRAESVREFTIPINRRQA